MNDGARPKDILQARVANKPMINYKICKQKKGLCGPASLKIVFDYYGIEKPQEEWARLAGTTADDGVQNEGMLKAIKSVGFSGEIIKEASFGLLKQLIGKGETVIVIFWSGKWGHYSPVADIDDSHITLADPEFGEFRKVELSEFDHFWFDFSKDYNRKPEDLELRSLILIKN